MGDFDNDGWQDFLVSNNGEDAQLFRNEGYISLLARNNHWLTIKLVGVNRIATASVR